MKNQVEVDKEMLPKVLDVLNLVIDFKKGTSKRKPKYSKDIYGVSVKIPKYKKITPQCINLVVNCIASHRYQEAINLLWILTQDKCINIPFLFKSIMIVLQNLEFNEKSESVWSCIQAFQDFSTINKKEVLLEYMMYALKSNTYDDQRYEAERRKKSFFKKCDKIESTFEAYRAMTEYMEWSKNNYSLGNFLSSQSHSNRQNILLIFEKLVQEPGNWDIFILKLIKILHCDSDNSNEINSQIEELLHTYVNNNSDNINAYIYLCTYLYHFNPEPLNLEKYLKIIASMDPSDVRILWLFEILAQQKVDLATRLNYIFMFLDYPSNRKNVAAWRIMKQTLSEVTSNEDKQNIIQTFWVTRCRSWEWIHFNPRNIQDFKDRELVLQKVNVLSFFFHKHKYIKKAKKVFPDIKNEFNSCRMEVIEIGT